MGKFPTGGNATHDWHLLLTCERMNFLLHPPPGKKALFDAIRAARVNEDTHVGEPSISLGVPAAVHRGQIADGPRESAQMQETVFPT